MSRVFLLAFVGLLFGVMIVASRPGQASEPLRIAYLIPGSDKEPFWQSAGAFARAAAQDLGFILEVHYSFNDARRLVATGKAVAN